MEGGVVTKIHLQVYTAVAEFALREAFLILIYGLWNSWGHFYINFIPFEGKTVDGTYEDINFRRLTSPNSKSRHVNWITTPEMTLFSPSFIEVNRIQKNLLSQLFCTLKLIEMNEGGVKLGFCSPALPFLRVAVLLLQGRLEKYLLTSGKKCKALF